MTGIRRIAHEEGTEVLRLARGARLGQAESKDYQREVNDAETTLGLR